MRRRDEVLPRRRFTGFDVPLFGLLAGGGAVGWWGVGLSPVGSWLVAVNLTAVAIYGYDKMVAIHGGWRVPEKVLLGLALGGGILGALLGMVLFRHKTSKPEFLIRLRWVVVALLVAGVLSWFAGTGYDTFAASQSITH